MLDIDIWYHDENLPLCCVAVRSSVILTAHIHEETSLFLCVHSGGAILTDILMILLQYYSLGNLQIFCDCSPVGPFHYHNL